MNVNPPIFFFSPYDQYEIQDAFSSPRSFSPSPTSDRFLIHKYLDSAHFDLKVEIENNQKDYEKMLDQAADEISSFVEKASLKKLS